MLTVVFIILLFILSLFSTLANSWLLVALNVIFLFVLVGLSPTFYGCESLGVFVLVALFGLPMNIRLSITFANVLGSGFIWLGRIAWGVLAFSVLMSIEEISCVLVSRLLWLNQANHLLDRVENRNQIDFKYDRIESHW